MVPHMLQRSQPVSDAQLEAGVHYSISTMQHYIACPSNQLSARILHRFFKEAAVVLDAAEKRGLQRTLQPNTLGRLRILLERFQEQRQSQGLI